MLQVEICTSAGNLSKPTGSVCPLFNLSSELSIFANRIFQHMQSATKMIALHCKFGFQQISIALIVLSILEHFNLVLSVFLLIFTLSMQRQLPLQIFISKLKVLNSRLDIKLQNKFITNFELWSLNYGFSNRMRFSGYLTDLSFEMCAYFF